jgi:hypothetical protein
MMTNGTAMARQNSATFSSLLSAAPRDKWIALSEDETRIVGVGDTMEEAVSAASAAGVEEPILFKTPLQWGYSVL